MQQKINPFKREVEKVQDLFNKVYGNATVFNQNERISVLLSIIRLNVLCRDISKPKKKELLQIEIEEFNHLRKGLFDYLTSILKNHKRKEVFYGTDREAKRTAVAGS